MTSRLNLIDACASQALQPMCEAVFSGLSAQPRTLPCRFFYDQAGSELFEQITELPEYYLTRCEAEILSHSANRIISAAGSQISIVEFGSGSSAKTRYLLSAALASQKELRYVPIDISRTFLEQSAKELLKEYPRLFVTAIAAEYNDAIAYVPNDIGPRLFVFLGSNIGNFSHDEARAFLQTLSGIMTAEDHLLLGADLVKPIDVLHEAYNDPAGVTADFNLNLLRRINDELGANFDLDGFDHHAPFDHDHSRIEMRLVSRAEQSVYIQDLETTFKFLPGEVIQTEWSHKYTRESLETLASEAGLHVVEQWVDSKCYFSEFLLQKAEAPA